MFEFIKFEWIYKIVSLPTQWTNSGHGDKYFCTNNFVFGLYFLSIMPINNWQAYCKSINNWSKNIFEIRLRKTKFPQLSKNNEITKFSLGFCNS